jgi:ABC-type bacteriocin/lantibiotic exporter with double-glycine peptidase domain
LIKLNNPTDGTIFLNGISYSDISLKDIRKKIGYVPQQPVLFNRSILDNIKYSNINISNETIMSLLHELNLIEAFSNLENGLDTKIGKNGSKISGGQRQLIWSLRILLHDPEILILDEPTASLDEKTKSLLIRLYDHFMGDKTIIMVTHDQTLMKYARRTIVLDSGRIVKDYSNSRY